MGRTNQLFAISLFALVLAASTACMSRHGGESGTATSGDSPPTETAISLPDDAPDPDEPATADEPPQPSAVARYTDDIEGSGALMAAIHTTQGVIECELFAEHAPITVANFVGLARGLKAFVDPTIGEPVTGVPFYDGVIFHRVVPGFLIQTGDRTGHGGTGPGYTIPDEFSEELRHDRPGMLSMANRDGPNSGGSQFFITEIAAPHFDDRHTIFGHCDSPQVIRAISHVPTTTMNRPVNPAPQIESISIYRAD